MQIFVFEDNSQALFLYYATSIITASYQLEYIPAYFSKRKKGGGVSEISAMKKNINILRNF